MVWGAYAPHHSILSIGWGSWIRTSDCRSQSPVPYRLAIPQYPNRCSRACGSISSFDAPSAPYTQSESMRHIDAGALEKPACAVTNNTTPIRLGGDYDSRLPTRFLQTGNYRSKGRTRLFLRRSARRPPSIDRKASYERLIRSPGLVPLTHQP